MRHDTALPTGAMYSAIAAIIADAKAQGVTRLSLGAVPDTTGTDFVSRLLHRKKAGLRQFKSAFDPVWTPRYLAAPTRFWFGVAALTILWHTQRPWECAATRISTTLTMLINIPKIIHLLQLRARVKTPAPQKDAPDDQYTLPAPEHTRLAAG